MMIEAGSDAAAHVFLHAEATEGDTDKGSSLFGGTHDLTAIAIGQSDALIRPSNVRPQEV